MVDKDTYNLEHLDRLGTKIEETIKKINALNLRCDTLARDNEMLLEQLETVRDQNRYLSRVIDELKEAGEEVQGADREEIIRRIDGMLEKFGELQI